MPDSYLIDHCSPTLAGLKTANLFPVKVSRKEDLYREIRRLNGILRPKGLCVLVLKRTENKALLYVYRPDFLEKDLTSPKARQILEEKGYVCGGSGKCIAQLMRHMREDEEFPHEVGLFLGYPPEDVKCFMKSSRQGVKCVGCWKAYGNETEARETFRRFRKCTETYKREYSRGRSLAQLAIRIQGK